MDTHSLIGEYVIEWDWASASLSARHDDNSDFDDANDYRAALRIPIVTTATTLFLNAGTGTKGSDVRGTLRLHAGHVHRQSRICARNDRAAFQQRSSNMHSATSTHRARHRFPRPAAKTRSTDLSSTRTPAASRRSTRTARASATASNCRCRRSSSDNAAVADRLHLSRRDATRQRQARRRTAPTAQQRPRHRGLRRVAGSVDVADRRGVRRRPR